MKFRSELEDYLDKVDKEKSQKFQEMLLTLGSFAKSGDLKANPIDSQSLDKFQLNNFYYEREWRSVSMWEFDKKDVATIIVPEDKVIPLREHIISHDMRVDEHTIILPYNMVYRL